MPGCRWSSSTPTELDLTLSRLPDRNLVRAFDEDWFGRSLTVWDESWFNETLAEQVWEGTAEVATELNRDVTTRLPIGEAIDEMAPGVYVLHASIDGQSQDDSPPASQWFVISDIGLTTMMGADGLHVFARSLDHRRADGRREGGAAVARQRRARHGR